MDALATKLRAITLSGAITTAAGCLYAQYFLYLDANIAYGSWISIEALLAAIVGGAGIVGFLRRLRAPRTAGVR